MSGDGCEGDVLGFHVQCAVCPQRAMLRTQPTAEWTCPRCAEVSSQDADAVEEYPVEQVRI